MRWFVFVALAAVATSGMTSVQEAPDTVNPRDLQIRQLEWQKSFLLSLAEAMPEDLYRDKVTPEQRDFAQQLHHAAIFPPLICNRAILGTDFTPPDTASVFNSAEAMKAFISESLDFCIDVVENQTDEDRAMMTRGFEGEEVPKSELLDQVYLHSAYTLGQVVANFRKHGMAPPEYPFF